jgi:glutamate-1-semialdehyde 2,1-aminomutase
MEDTLSTSIERSGTGGVKLSVAASEAYDRQAGQCIPGGVNSNVRLAAPRLCFTRGAGCHLYDLDGNDYIDYALGMGPTILGHAHPVVVKAVKECLDLGQVLAGQHPYELQLAQLLITCIPSARRVRIGLSGSEVVQAALRVARAHTRRSAIIKFEGQYHGWFDSVLVNHSGPPNDPAGPVPFPVHLQTEGQAKSATVDTYVLPWNDLSAVSRLLKGRGDEIAALITEPIMCNSGVIFPREGYLQGLRELCDHYGVVLIFDEVITGFRVGLSGGQGQYGVTPDLSTFAKAMGGGFPVAALVGKAEIMDRFGTGAVNHSGTYNSNLVSLAAGIATIKELSANDGLLLRKIAELGQELMSGIRDAACRHGSNLKVQGHGSVFNTFFSDAPEMFDYASFKRSDADRLKAFLDALLSVGIRPTPRGTWFISAAHSLADVERTLAGVNEVLQEGACK